MSIGKQFFLAFLLLGGISANVAGQAARSPFTTFGIGEPYGDALIQSQGMGGVGVSQPQYFYINNQNPALLVYNMNTMFQAGIVGERRTISGDTLSQKSSNGNLNYLITAFNVSKRPGRWTTSIGLMPYTTVNYEMAYTAPATDPDGNEVDDANVLESGNGGLTQFYWSNGVRINKYFSAGVKAAYLFGPVETVYSNSVPAPDQGFPFLVTVKEKTRARGFQFSFGGHFMKDSLGRRQDKQISAGVVYTLGSDLRSERRAEISRSMSSGGNVLDGDTLFTRRGYIKIPSSTTFGVSFSKGINWSIGTEFTMQDWNSFSSINQDDEGLGKAWRWGLGGEYTPDPSSVTNYLKRITYRVGFSLEQLPFLIDGDPNDENTDLNKMNDIGATAGFSLPVRGSSLDFAFKYGKRGDRSETVLEESYFKIYFGLTFNDRWFIKRKFD